MDGGLLSLKWNNHRSTFFYVLSNVRKKECYTDVTIACDGKFYPVHKLILSTCSEYFEQMFEQTQCKHPVIVLKDIRSEELESLLSYMYVGEVNVVQEKLSGLINAAECLRIKGLAVPDEEPQTTKSSGGSREKRTSDNSLSSDAKRRRQDDSSFSSPKQSSTNNSREDSSRRRGDQSSSKMNKNSAPSTSNSNSTVNSSRETRENRRTSNSNNRDSSQSGELQQSAAGTLAVNEGIKFEAEDPPDFEEDIPAEVPVLYTSDDFKQEPIDLDVVYQSDSNAASEPKDMPIKDSCEEIVGQLHFMDELLGQNSSEDQHDGADEVFEEEDGCSAPCSTDTTQHEKVVDARRPEPDHTLDLLMQETLGADSWRPHPHQGVHNDSVAVAGNSSMSITFNNNNSNDNPSTSPKNNSPILPLEMLDLALLEVTEGVYRCPVCLTLIKHLHHFKRHYKIHRETQPHACSLCPYRSWRRNNLRAHLFRIHGVQ